MPVLKQLVEVLFSRGLMMVVFATDTLALGVNMPARTVVIGRMTKWDGRRRRPLIPNEVQQMAGRAGRRGMDVFGHVVLPYSPWIPFREMLEIATGPLHPVQSAFAIRYNTVLNLWDPPTGDRVRQMLQRSLAQYQTSQRIRLIEQDILEVEAELAGMVDGQQDELQRLDDAFEDYRSIDRRLQTMQSAQRKIEQEATRLEATISSATPWTEPTRQALRRAFRTTLAGDIAHVRDHGWAIYLGRGSQGGIGIFLTLNPPAFLQPSEYRQIDYLPDDARVEVPAALIEPFDPTVSPESLASAEELSNLASQLDAIDLPDLEALALDYREREKETLASERLRLGAEIEELNAAGIRTPGAAPRACVCRLVTSEAPSAVASCPRCVGKRSVTISLMSWNVNSMRKTFGSGT